MPNPTTAPTATPAPAPTSTPAAQASPPPAPTTGAWSTTTMPDHATPPEPTPPAAAPSISIMDEINAAAGLPKSQPATPPVAADDQPADPPPADTTPTTAPKPPAADPAATQPPKSAKSLRSELEDLRAQIATISQERDALKAAHPKDREELTKFAQELEELRTAKAELETKLQFTDYQNSPEFQSKYAKPLEDALASAYNDLAQIEVTKEDGTTRPGTPEDFNDLLRLNLQQAIKTATDRFGTAAPEVLALRRKTLELHQRNQQALADFKASADSRKQLATQQELAAKAEWDSHQAFLTQKFPELYAPDPNDKIGNDLLTSGASFVNKAFNPPKDISPKDLAVFRSEVAARATAFGRVVHRNIQLQSQIQTLQTELAAYRKSEPGPGLPGSPAPSSKPKSWQDEIDEAAR